MTGISTLAKHKPELYAELSKNLKPANDYVDGLLKGGKQYELELTKSHSAISKDQIRDRKRDDDFGKDR